MPTPILTPAPEVIEFEPMLEKLSDRLGVVDRPRLSLFVRNAIEKMVGPFLKGKRGKIDPNQIKYFMPASFRIGIQAELAMVSEKRNRIQELCSMGFKVDKYRGMPDGTFGVNLDSLPPLVNRQKVVIKDIRPADAVLWMEAGRLANQMKEYGKKDLQLDIQLEPSALPSNYNR